MSIGDLLSTQVEFDRLRARVDELTAECAQHLEEISRLQADIIQMRGWVATPDGMRAAPTIDSVPSCGSENDYRNAQPRPAQSPAGAELGAKILRCLKWHYGAEGNDLLDPGAVRLIADLVQEAGVIGR